MKWANYHTHSIFSDGEHTMESILKEAISQNMYAIGFSDHAPLDIDVNWCMDKWKLPNYTKEITSLKALYESKIQIYTGLEVDYIPNLISPISDWVLALQLDYTIGSVHFVDSFEDGTPWSIESTENAFRSGLHHIFKDDISLAVSRYYELIREMIYFATPTVIGHLDRIQKHNKFNVFFNENEDWYLNQVEKTLKVIADFGVILEVNTKTFYSGNQRMFNPGKNILKLAAKMDIPVTLSSDAHQATHLTSGFLPALKLLEEVGYTHISILIDGFWKRVPFSSQTGLVLNKLIGAW